MRQSEWKVGGDPGGGRAAQIHGGETKRLVQQGREVGGEEGKVEKGWKEGGESESKRLSAVNSFSKEQWQEAVGTLEKQECWKRRENSIVFMTVAAIRLAAKI